MRAIAKQLLNLLLSEALFQILLLHLGKHVIQKAPLDAQLIRLCLQQHVEVTGHDQYHALLQLPEALLQQNSRETRVLVMAR